MKLNPGIVFESGCHASTKKCLESFTMIFRSGKPKTVLGLVGGIGILSIAAAKLGAKKVLALDLNNLAVETARENVLFNHVEATAEVIEGDAFNWV
jgi:ribosomal protein L11 methyltransferase